MDDDLETLFRSEYAPLVRALAVACGDAERAADAVQDAFVQAHRHWRTIRLYDSPGGWLRRVALHRLADQRRSSRRAAARVERLGLHQQLGAAPGTARGDGTTDAAVLELRAALAGLPERQRLAVCLHYLADLPVDEVAELLDVAPGTVKSQLHDARANLLRTLEVPDDA